MALNQKQQILYTDICDIYNPVSIASGTRLKNGEIQDQHYPSTPSISNEYFFHETEPEIEKGRFYGRINKEDTVSILDRGHFDCATDIKVNAVIYLKTEGDRNVDNWYLVLGEGKQKNYRANKQVFFLKNITKPPGIA